MVLCAVRLRVGGAALGRRRGLQGAVKNWSPAMSSKCLAKLHGALSRLFYHVACNLSGIASGVVQGSDFRARNPTRTEFRDSNLSNSPAALRLSPRPRPLGRAGPQLGSLLLKVYLESHSQSAACADPVIVFRPEWV